MALAEFTVAQVKINAIRVKDAVETIHRWIQDKRRDYVVLTGAHGVVEMQSDPELLRINNESGMTTPDGMSVVWMGRLKGHKDIEKVYAPDIMLETFKFGLEHGFRHFFYGGGEGLADELAQRVTERFPGIHIAGTYTPPFRPLDDKEAKEVADQIDEAEPAIVWVGLGCPKQEKWMARFRPLLKAPVLIGVGAGFDFLADRKPLAPRWVQVSGFEWLFRLLSEPRRLWPRYSRVVPIFLYLAIRELVRTGFRSGRKSDTG